MRPPAATRQPSLIEVDVDRLAEHKYFVPLGPSVKSDAPAGDAFSMLRVDHTITRFKVGSQQEKAVMLIFSHLMYESKPQPPCKEIPRSHRSGADNTRGPFFTVRQHDHKPPSKGSHKEILIFGSTQLSKTPEAAASAWAACFVDGCVPIIGVRNKGGANTGSTDMANGITKLNQRIEQLFKHEVAQGNLMLPQEDFRKLLLHPRKTSNKEQILFDPNNRTLKEPQALIVCMNASQIKHLIGSGSADASAAGAESGLLEIMKGNTNHPYPPKCHDPYAPFDDGANRPVARVYFILDEDDLNRSNAATAVTERLQFHAPPDVMRRLNKGLGELVTSAQQAATAASGSNDDPVPLDDDDDEPTPIDDDDDETVAGAFADRSEVDEERMRNEFRNQMDSTGVRSAVRGVVALTATPSACGHDLSEGASQVKHHICAMEHPSNYVGYSFTAAPYAERTIQHEPVPDRKQITAIKKTPIYREVLSRHGWWDTLSCDKGLSQPL
jgi:hypothetical protein